MKKILIVDDHPSIVETLSETLSREGYNTHAASTPQEALDKIPVFNPDLLIFDIFYGDNLPDGDWLIQEVKKSFPTLPAIAISGESDIYKILDCLNHGALDFVMKPLSVQRLLTTTKNALALAHSQKSRQDACQFLGESDTTRSLLEKVRKVAKLTDAVLIRGESGTGKELIAQNLHLHSNRADHPYFALNCAALNPDLIESELFGHKRGSFTGADDDKQGFFEKAHGGTLFLDEIGDLPSSLQAKLLRVLQEQQIVRVGDTEPIKIDVRIICATHQPLEKMIEENQFREDLFYRISTFQLQIPPLRDRLEDLDTLAPHFLQNFLSENNLSFKSFSKEALSHLRTYGYPGNVRELGMIIKNAALFTESDTITPENIDFHNKSNDHSLLTKVSTLELGDAKRELETALIQARLKMHQNNVSKTAESLGLLTQNLHRKLRDLGIN